MHLDLGRIGVTEIEQRLVAEVVQLFVEPLTRSFDFINSLDPLDLA